MRFSIRDLLWVTVVVALGVGWWIDYYRPGNYRRHQLEVRAAAMQFALKDQGFVVEQEALRVRVYRPSNLEKNDYETERRLHSSSAPAPNPPND